MIRRLVVCASLVGCTSPEPPPPIPGEPVAVQLAPHRADAPCGSFSVAKDGTALGHTTFAYDDRGRDVQDVGTSQDGSTDITNYGWDNMDRWIHLDDTEGTDFSDVWDLTYDSLGDLVDVTDTSTFDGETTAFHLTYANFDDRGNPGTMTDSESPGTVTFSYDTLGRLVHGDYPADDGSSPGSFEDVVYDETTRTATQTTTTPTGTVQMTVTATYDEQNRLLTRFTDLGMGIGGALYDYDGDRVIDEILYRHGAVTTRTTFLYDCSN